MSQQAGQEKEKKTKGMRRVLPNDVYQNPELDQTAHYANPPVPHQHLAWGLVLKEKVREGIGDLALHLLSLTDPQRGGSLSSTPLAH